MKELYEELEQRIEYLQSLPRTDFVSGKICELILVIDKIEELKKKRIMSGGYFDYDQWKIGNIADTIEDVLERQGKEKSKEELWMSREYYEQYPEEKYQYTYPEIIQEKFKEAIKALRIAHIYAKRVDYYLSSDDGEESFLSRLKEELEKCK